MYITITSLELKGPLHFFKLAGIALSISRQLKSSEGFVQYKKTGFWTSHYTMSLWKSENDLKNFARSGAHLDAMKRYKDVAMEIRTLTLMADRFPAWSMAKEMLQKNGKVIN
jgi:heme-degrading monooxygenase HmoA